ncbi:MAG: diguanylate cyclase [Candidatus Pseudothioglobus sp.]|jgi:diguanylate cyclase (GGDEF)-like protein
MSNSEARVLGRRSAEEKLIVAVSTATGIVLLPFAIMRWVLGDLWLSILGFCGVALVLWLLVSVLYYRETRISGAVLSLLVVMGMVGNVYMRGPSEAFFLFPVMVAAYFIVTPNVALSISVLALVTLMPGMMKALDLSNVANFYLSIISCLLFTYAFAVHRNAQRDQLLLFSTKDSLTGAGNRRLLDERLGDVIARHKRVEAPMSLLLLDIDRFKRVNDSAGHAVGDRLLVRVTEIVRDRIRSTDTLFRYGGDEFIVYVDGSDLETAASLAEDIRALVEADLNTSGWQLSISLGVAEYCRGEDQAAWIGRADEALLESKRQGRNRVALSPVSLLDAV